MADVEIRPQLSSYCRRDDHHGCQSAQARCACSCHGVAGQQPPVPVRPSVVQPSPLAARVREEADQIAERREAVASIEAPRGPEPGKRRDWSDEDKARIVAEAKRDGGRVVMARYQLAGSVLNRWIRDAQAAARPAPTPKLTERATELAARPAQPAPAPEAASPDDAVAVAVGHLRWHRDHLADRLAKIDAVLAVLAALDELGGDE